jgi:outer membrane scaffolding protein for murein synthesis (MipA/OmpV family)
MKKTIASILLLAPFAALAQQVLPDDYTLLGAAVRTRPAYDGSLSQKTDLVPVVRYYGQPWFARTTQGILEGGLHWALGSGVAAGFQLSYDEGRKSSESAFLREHNFNDDIDPGASVGAHLEWDTKVGPAPVGLMLRYRQSLDSDRGSLADARLNVGVYGSGGATVVLFAEATWGSSKANGTFYGVTPEQSAASGFAAYQPGSGMRHVGLGVIGGYDLSRHWTLVGSLQQRWLQGDVAQSPLADCRQNTYANAGIAYRF